MSLLFALSISTGIISGLLVWFTGLFDIASWLAFLGATSYFASTDKGMKGLVQVWLSNVSGAIWAMLIVVASTYIEADFGAYLTTAVVSFFMCFQAKFKLLKFIPGTFLGAAAVFSSNGQWMSACLGLFVGAIFGFLMTYCGEILHKHNELRLSKNETSTKQIPNQSNIQKNNKLKDQIIR
jgi:cell division protein FtsW (lipid II flippase)